MRSICVGVCENELNKFRLNEKKRKFTIKMGLNIRLIIQVYLKVILI